MRPSIALTEFFVTVVVMVLVAWSYVLSVALRPPGPPERGTASFPWIVAGLTMVMAAELLVAATGVLAQFEAMPPAIGRLLVPVILINVYVSSFSALGRKLADRLSYQALVGFQVFRLGPELFLHFGYLEGSLPRQMTWPPEGRNIDVFVVAFAFAMILGYQVRRVPMPVPLVWSFAVFGLVSLLNIAYTSIRSLTYAIRPADFEPGLEVAAHPPFVVLPGFLVQVALCSHLLLLRRLSHPPPPSETGSSEMW